MMDRGGNDYKYKYFSIATTPTRKRFLILIIDLLYPRAPPLIRLDFMIPRVLKNLID